MGTYGNNQMTIKTGAACFADILEMELRSATENFKAGFEWERNGTEFHFQGTGDKVAWIRNDKLNPLDLLCEWNGDDAEREFPASVNLARMWDSEVWFYSTDFASEEIHFDDVVDAAVELDIFPDQDGPEEKLEAIKMWKTENDDDFYEWCWDKEVYYDDDLATIYFDWNGQEWNESSWEAQRQINIRNTIKSLAHDYFGR